MSGFDPEQLVVAGTGHIYVADVDTMTFPEDIDDIATLEDDGWIDLGYTTTDGPRFSFARESKDVEAWQEFDPIRTLITNLPKQIEFDLEQWNADTVGLGLGGVEITSTANGSMVEPKESSFVDLKALVVAGTDGDRNYAFCYRRTQNTKPLTFPFRREDISPLTIGMKVFAAGSGEKPFRILTDDPAFAVGS